MYQKNITFNRGDRVKILYTQFKKHTNNISLTTGTICEILSSNTRTHKALVMAPNNTQIECQFSDIKFTNR